ncbi:MAG: hypothetical protein ABI353_20595, partial [Isosphaeraceae bacterium]
VAVLVPVCFATKISFLWYAMIGCLVTMAVGYVVSLFESPPLPAQLDGLTWGDRASTKAKPVASTSLNHDLS